MVLCYASSELGVAPAELSKCIGISEPGVGYSAERGRQIVREYGYQLLE